MQNGRLTRIVGLNIRPDITGVNGAGGHKHRRRGYLKTFRCANQIIALQNYCKKILNMPMPNLSGMKRICQYCNRSESTILIWIRALGFPAAKFSGSWESDSEMVDDWRRKQIKSSMENKQAGKVAKW